MSADREQYIVDVLVDAFEDLIESDPHAFRKKFRKMAAGPFPFYRGTACLFYADVHGREDPWVDERTKRVWIQGDLHAENYGTYMNSQGKLVFDVNDFDEAYVGHYTWDLQRMAASLALLGFAKALSDKVINEMIETYSRSYLDQLERSKGFAADKIAAARSDLAKAEKLSGQGRKDALTALATRLHTEANSAGDQAKAHKMAGSVGDLAK